MVAAAPPFHQVPPGMEIDPVVKAVCGAQHSLLLTRSGLVFAMGKAADGAIGTGEAKDADKYVLLPGVRTFISVCDRWHLCSSSAWPSFGFLNERL